MHPPFSSWQHPSLLSPCSEQCDSRQPRASHYFLEREAGGEEALFLEKILLLGAQCWVLVWFVAVFLCRAFRLEKAGTKSILVTEYGPWETCDSSRCWGGLFTVWNWLSVKFCLPYRFICPVLSCCGSGHEHKDKNLALG